MLKLTVLGCSSKGNCYLLENDDTLIMLDCGVNIQKTLKNIDLKKLKGILITHCHTDHTKSLDTFKYYTLSKIYGNDEALNKFSLVNEQKEVVNEEEPFNIGSFTIMPFQVFHDVKNYNYLIKDNINNYKLLYITDCGRIPEYQFTNINAFLIEANYNEQWYEGKIELKPKEIRNLKGLGHLSVQKTFNFLKENINDKTKLILLTHISYEIQNYKEMEEYIKNMIRKETNKNKIKVVALNPKIDKPKKIILKEGIC